MLEESEISCHYHAAIKFFGQESGVTTQRSEFLFDIHLPQPECDIAVV